MAAAQDFTILYRGVIYDMCLLLILQRHDEPYQLRYSLADNLAIVASPTGFVQDVKCIRHSGIIGVELSKANVDELVAEIKAKYIELTYQANSQELTSNVPN